MNNKYTGSSSTSSLTEKNSSSTNLRAALLLTGLLLGLVLAQTTDAQIQFEDVTGAAGINYEGESWGASWGDLNADGWPDLFVNNHRGDPSLLVNLGNGSFQDRWEEVNIWAEFPFLDQHGATWGDFNNDGFEDLFVSLGSRDDMQLLVNDNGVLIDRTLEFGLDAYTSWPGRLPAWLDYNNDGNLDWIMSTRGYAKTFKYSGGGWVDESFVVGPACQNTQYTQLIDVDNDGSLDAVCDNQTHWPNKVYDTTTIPFTSLAGLLPQQGAVNDTAIGDFDNNLRNDIFQVRGLFRLSEAKIDPVTQKQIEAQLILDDGGNEDKYIRFKTDGVLSFVDSWNARNVNNIFIGSTGYHPTGFGPEDQIRYDVDPADPINWGIKPHDPSSQDGIWIGYDNATGYWDVRISAGTTIQMHYIFIDSTEVITDLTTGGFPVGESPYDPKLMMNFDGGFVEQADSRGLQDPIQCISTAAADLDNDMDTDIYVACRGGVTNIQNIIYENQGDGTFLALPGGGVADGPLGLGVGTAESVVLADYDVDGFMDIFVTNGLNIYPEEPLYEDRGGPNKLYRNLGNSNRWIELQLVGTESNRSAVGAKVYATAGGVTQLREQNGGYHRWSQNHSRIHFGLGSNDLVSFTVEWPKGQIDTYEDVDANQLYEVIEGTGIVPIVLGEVAPSVCAKPDIDLAGEAELFVWQDCATKEWHVFTSAGPVSSVFEGQITSGGNITGYADLSIESNDVIDISDPSAINFLMRAYNASWDEFSFLAPDDEPLCLEVTSPTNYQTIFVGNARLPVNNPFDLNTLGACDGAAPSVDISVSDISVDETAGIATFKVSLSSIQTQPIDVDYATADGTATDANDYVGNTDTVSFAPGDTEQDVNITIIDDGDGEIDESFSLQLTNTNFGTITQATATATIVDNEISACGKPVVDSSVDSAIFIWTDCQGNNTWNLLATAGQNTRGYLGVIVSPQPYLAVTPINIEDDLLENDGIGEISYGLQVTGSGQDEFSFQPANSTDELCFDPQFPIEQVYIGNDRLPFDIPLNLTDLDACATNACHSDN